VVDELHGAVDRLVQGFVGVYARETVAECVHDSRARLGVQRIKTSEALLAYRFARQRLRAGAVVSGLLTDEFVAAADVVITMGCGDACPVVPGRRYVDWDLPDPEGAGPDELRRIRDEVSERVDLLLHELLGP